MKFSLVGKSWMGITREIIFLGISLGAIFRPVELELGLLQILPNPHCTFVPYVEIIAIRGNVDEPTPWLGCFLSHTMHRFTALKTLKIGALNLNVIDRAIPPAIKRDIRELEIWDQTSAAFISKFTNLTTLTCGEIYVE
ncbi:hypothetical protein B0H14DRAFT_2596833 [Mycena olivaceomarginata]|nr:hypothetical protein B0H14DRAFT_2596833 [Mycena olivaceomarginata]